MQNRQQKAITKTDWESIYLRHVVSDPECSCSLFSIDQHCAAFYLLPKDTYPKVISPKDILPTDILPNAQFDD